MCMRVASGGSERSAAFSACVKIQVQHAVRLSGRSLRLHEAGQKMWIQTLSPDLPVPASFFCVVKTWFITGTDTGAGKTVLTSLLARYLYELGLRVAALKPVCSGGRDDARLLFNAIDGSLTIDEINPWFFQAAIAPTLAARQENKSVSRRAVHAHIQNWREKSEAILVEGAGGLLSPLGVKFNSRDLIADLDATPIIVAPDKLGVVNQLLLTLEALSAKTTAKARIVLVSPATPDTATGSNAGLLAESFPAKRTFSLPWLGKPYSPEEVVRRPDIRQMLQQVLEM